MRLSDRSNPSPDFIGDKSTFLTIQITIKVTDALLQGIAAFCEGFGIGYSQRKFRGTIWLIVQLWQSDKNNLHVNLLLLKMLA